MDKTIWLTRHCEGEHNVSDSNDIRDAPLTAKGRQQARDLDRATRTNIQKEVELIVSSPFRRTMQTTLGGYPEAIERLGGKEKIVLLPEAQECNDDPQDTGSKRETLQKDPEFSGMDMSRLDDDWISKKGKYSADVPALKARARAVRQFLRDRTEKKIVLVAHGDLLSYIAHGDDDGLSWTNGEVRKFEFLSDEGQDAWLKRVEIVAKPTSGDRAVHLPSQALPNMND